MTVVFKDPVAVPHKYRNRFLRDGVVSNNDTSSSSGSSSVDLSAYLRTSEAASMYQPKGDYLASDGKAASASVADKVTSNSYTAWGQTFISGGIPQSFSGDMTSVGEIIFGMLRNGRYTRLTNDANAFGIVTNKAEGTDKQWHQPVLIYDGGSNDRVKIYGLTSMRENTNIGINRDNPIYPLDVNGDMRIGNAIAHYDSETKMLSFTDHSGDPLNIVTTGGMTSYGNEDEGIDGVKNFTVKDTLTIGDGDNDTSGIIKYYSASAGDFLTINDLQLVNNELFMMINGSTFKVGLTPV